MNKFDLEERLIEFSVLVIEIVNEMPKTRAGNHLSGQLVRSGTSVSLNYGEAQSGESRKDFIHKMKIVLKELRERQSLREHFQKYNNIVNRLLFV
jgi:four helix bundle protein